MHTARVGLYLLALRLLRVQRPHMNTAMTPRRHSLFEQGWMLMQLREKAALQFKGREELDLLAAYYWWRSDFLRI